MLLIITLCFGISSLLIPRLIQRIIPKHIYLITISSSFFCAASIVFSLHSNKEMICWILSPAMGIVFGIACIASEMCVLEMQPKQHSGKVNGIKNSIRILLRFSTSFAVGLFWNESQGDSLWIAIAICSMLVAVISLPMMCLARNIETN